MSEFVKHTHEHIRLCKKCSGSGELSRYNEQQRAVEAQVCHVCQGSGRVMLSRVLTTNVKPYIPVKE